VNLVKFGHKLEHRPILALPKGSVAQVVVRYGTGLCAYSNNNKTRKKIRPGTKKTLASS